jgi:AmmeMemoRadiSam system protein B/AmmeMemoRadiSam system protein A
MNRMPKNPDGAARQPTRRNARPRRRALAMPFAALLAAFAVAACRRTAPAADEPAPIEREPPAAAADVVLRSTLAGKWYPADPVALNAEITEVFAKAEAEPDRNVAALILPHAGYPYSGRTAATGLKTAGGAYSRVVVIGPSHYVPLQDVLSVPSATHYETPLGRIPLDVAFISRLREHAIFREIPEANAREHSTQIMAPLLQTALRRFTLVPIVAGHCSESTIAKAAAVLKSLVDDKTLVIASSDFTHFGPNYSYVPFTDNIPERLKQLDRGAMAHIQSLDGAGFLDYQRRTGATICGTLPIAILLAMLDSTFAARQIAYATSGEVTGDFANSVSYLAVAFSGRWRRAPAVKPDPANATLSEADRHLLLTLARQSLRFYLRERRRPDLAELTATNLSATLQRPRGTFVTLKEGGRLRGCIGEIFPRQPLVQSVIANAINAGVNDPRFTPVTEAECDQLVFEISALTSPSPVASSEAIRIGTDGVVLSRNGRSAVFLPQVATEQGWNRDQMLTALSRKAGLPPDAWREGATFLVFQAEVFGEAE